MNRNNRELLVLLAALVAVSLIGPVFGGAVTWGYGPRGNPSGTSGWTWGLGMGLGWLSTLAFWGILIVGFVLPVRWLGGTTTGSGREDQALRTLPRRYAAGDISHEERRKALGR